MSYELVKKAEPCLDPYAPCEHTDCIYRAAPRSFHGCNFMEITGKSRIALHDPTENSPAHCRLYTPSAPLKKLVKEIFE